jgi:DNA (cytosine-5)-methyltransferase 1
MELTVLDLFSGIGGFSVGLEAAGKFKTIGFCEQDKFCQKVLRKHWNDVPIYEDIKKLDARKIKADVLVGGFPCQSISIAGKQKGKDDDRFLFPQMLRVIKEVKPKWIIGENVQNLLNISNGEILQGIHNDLEACSYEVQTFSISASSQGAWHKRARVWIVAALSNSKCDKRQDTSTRQSGASEIRGIYFEKEKQTSHDLWSKTSRCDAPPKQQTWWEQEHEALTKICRVPHGLSAELDTNRNDRIKALGNSICPPIITEIGKAIIKAEEENV